MLFFRRYGRQLGPTCFAGSLEEHQEEDGEDGEDEPAQEHDPFVPPPTYEEARASRYKELLYGSVLFIEDIFLHGWFYGQMVLIVNRRGREKCDFPPTPITDRNFWKWCIDIK